MPCRGWVMRSVEVVDEDSSADEPAVRGGFPYGTALGFLVGGGVLGESDFPDVRHVPPVLLDCGGSLGRGSDGSDVEECPGGFHDGQLRDADFRGGGGVGGRPPVRVRRCLAHPAHGGDAAGKDVGGEDVQEFGARSGAGVEVDGASGSAMGVGGMARLCSTVAAVIRIAIPRPARPAAWASGPGRGGCRPVAPAPSVPSATRSWWIRPGRSRWRRAGRTPVRPRRAG